MPIVSTTVPFVSTAAVPVVSTTTMPVVGSTSTPTLVRVKRRLTEEPNDVLVLSAKRLKSCDAGTRCTSTSFFSVLRIRMFIPDLNFSVPESRGYKRHRIP